MSRLLRRLTSSRAMGASPQSAPSAGNAASAAPSPPVLWTVRVRVVEASDLMEKRLVLRAAPYCFLQLGAVRFTTAVGLFYLAFLDCWACLSLGELTELIIRVPLEKHCRE